MKPLNKVVFNRLDSCYLNDCKCVLYSTSEHSKLMVLTVALLKSVHAVCRYCICILIRSLKMVLSMRSKAKNKL